MPWLKVDDGFESHPKVKTIPRSKRVRAVGLWTLAGSWSARTLTNGHIAPHMLDEFAATKADAVHLVTANLWHTTGHACEDCPQPEADGGYVFHKWPEYQPTKEKVEAERAEARERMRRVRKGSGSGDVRANSERTSGEVRDARPVPSRPLSVVTSPFSPETAPRELDDDGLTRIRQALNGCPEAHARRTVAFVLAKAPTDVRNPTAYVLAAIADEPDAYRYRRGSPNRSQECPDHPGEWADACRAHAIDARLGGDR